MTPTAADVIAHVRVCAQVLGGMGFSASGAYPFERFLRDSRILLIFEGTNEILRLFIALTCLQSPGAELKQLAKSPLAALPVIGRELLAESTGVGLQAPQGIAPQLQQEAKELSVATAQFRQGVRTLLSRHGADITAPQHQLQVARLADCAMELYGWMAVLSRATASVAASAPHLEHELTLARAFIARAKGRLAALHTGIMNGERHNGDAAAYAIAADVLKAGHYLAAHPLRLQ